VSLLREVVQEFRADVVDATHRAGSSLLVQPQVTASIPLVDASIATRRPSAAPQTGKTAMRPRVLVVNGPNLNLLGKRQPEVYGHETLADVEEACRALGTDLGLEVACHQSNSEGAIVDALHAARETAAAVVINPGAYSHTSIAILDALNAFDGVVMEVHISNIHKREAFRHHSYVSLRADGIVVGCGTEGYLLALRRVASLVGSAS
jgi:3-dehydroquinate dehydratase-2